MGVLEEKTRKRKKKQKIQQAILTTLATAGVVSLAFLAPNTLQMLRYTPAMRGRYESRIKASLRRLRNRGLVRIDPDGVRLTERGNATLRTLEVSGTFKKPPRWDGSWRIVLFDIPERCRIARDRLRIMLERIGFKKLQASAWIFPYDCEELIELLKTDYAIGKNVIYIVSDAVEGDARLRQLFNLK